MRLIDTDKLIGLIDDDIAALNKDNNIPQIAYDVCLCTLQMIKQYIKALPTTETVPLDDYRSMEQTVYKLTQALALAEPIEVMAAKEQKAYNKGYADGMAQCVTDFDLVSVVRCKDCKHSLINEYHPNKPLICVLTRKCGTTTGEWYCADGERKSEVEE